MSNGGFGSPGKLRRHNTNRDSDDRIQYLLRAEEQLLHSISTHVALPKVLNEICSAIDLQIGNVVSLISLPGDDPGELAAIAGNAALFGLYTFYSEGIVDENEVPVGFLEMFCSVDRSPNAGELQLIERAKCLIAIAIQRHHDGAEKGNRTVRADMAARGRLPESPDSLN
jgi:hypothetical protein